MNVPPAENPDYGSIDYFREQLAEIIDLDCMDQFLKGLDKAIEDELVYHVNEGQKANGILQRIRSAYGVPDLREQ